MITNAKFAERTKLLRTGFTLMKSMTALWKDVTAQWKKYLAQRLCILKGLDFIRRTQND